MVRMSSDNEPSAHGSVPPEVTDFVRDVVGLWDHNLGSRLAGAYLIGSLAHGGYSVHYSDIDVAVIVQQPLTDADLSLAKASIAQQWPELAPRLSLFWADVTFSAGRFPPLDRIDYLDHRRPLLEHRRVLPARPALADVRSYLRGDPLRNWSQQAGRLSALQDLRPEDHKAYLRALLYPARFLYSWETGNVASNDDAVAYVGARNAAGFDIDLVKRALRCRNSGEGLDALFPDRRKLLDLARFCADRVGTPPGP
jgi:predicted nucleotidyltransferase